MEKRSKILLWTFLILVLASAGVIYYKYLILKDFEVIETETEDIIGEFETISE